MSSCCIIIPCFNEANRLKPNKFKLYLEQNKTHSIVFVDDGSSDDTFDRLQAINQICENRISVLQNEPNLGKAEAVRTGILWSQKLNCDYYGYLDADLSAPLNTVPYLIKEIQSQSNILVGFGSRIKTDDTLIKRNPLRHLLGRIFTRYVDFFLNINIYDTQCGAKVFKSESIQTLFQERFLTKWFFDIELVLRSDKSQILEIPIKKWVDKKGSKLKVKDFLSTPFQILKIYLKYKT